MNINGRLLLAINATLISRVLGIVYRVIAAQLIKQAGYRQQSTRTGAVTLIQRFCSALNLNVHCIYGDSILIKSAVREPAVLVLVATAARCLAPPQNVEHCAATAHDDTAITLRAGIMTEKTNTPPITMLLQRSRDGDKGSLDELMTAVYDDLKRIACGQLARWHHGQTINTTALVHESYLKLAIHCD